MRRSVFLRRAGSEDSLVAHDGQSWSCVLSLTNSAPRVLSLVDGGLPLRLEGARQRFLSVSAEGFCSGRSGTNLRVGAATSAHRYAAGAASSEVAPVWIEWALQREVPAFGSVPVLRRFAGVGPPRCGQALATSRRCGPERVGRWESGHGSRETDGCGQTLEWRLRTWKVRVSGLRIACSTR